MDYQVIEQFDSIQGEGVFMGKPATFIRLAGCNLTCPWCDTKESWSKKHGSLIPVEAIVADCHKELVVITGGEPLLWDLVPLARKLIQRKHFVAIETNGTLALPKELLPWITWVTCSPKPPLFEMKCCVNEVKFVVTEDNQREILGVIRSLSAKVTSVWLQPEGSNWQENVKRCYDMAMNYPELNMRVGIQLHRIMEVR